MSSEETPQWLETFLTASYFSRCPKHGASARAGCNFFCVDCNGDSTSLCALCNQEEHSGHTVLQVRKCSGHHAVRLDDVRHLLDMEGVQVYVINCAKVVFLNGRPQAKPRKDYPHRCRTCERSLMDACQFCSIACKLAPPEEGLSPPITSSLAEGRGSCPDSGASDGSDEDDRLINSNEDHERGQFSPMLGYLKQEEQEQGQEGCIQTFSPALAPSLDSALSPSEALSSPLNSPPFSGPSFMQQRRVRTKGRRRSKSQVVNSMLHIFDQSEEKASGAEQELKGPMSSTCSGKDPNLEHQKAGPTDVLRLGNSVVRSDQVAEEDLSDLLCRGTVFGAVQGVSPLGGDILTGWHDGFLIGKQHDAQEQEIGMEGMGTTALMHTGAFQAQAEHQGKGEDVSRNKNKRKISPEQSVEQQQVHQSWSDEGLGFLDLGPAEAVELEHGLLEDPWCTGKIWQEASTVGGVLGMELGDVNFHALAPGDPFEFAPVPEDAPKRAGSEGLGVCGELNSCVQEVSASF